MSVLHSDSGRFFIPEDLVYKMEWDEEDSIDHQLLIQKADTLASQNRIKEALDLFSVAIKHGSVRPEQLSTLVDCVLRNFKVAYGSDTDKTTPSKNDSYREDPGDKFCCPGCHRFLSEPVTVACGHTYCKRCLQLELYSKCKLCNNDMDTRCGSGQPHRTNVILLGILEKWFPDETKVSKVILEIEDLTRRRRFEEALVLSSNMIESDPGEVLGRIFRAESYAGLKQYESALKELEELCLNSLGSPEVYFQKGKILQEMGCANKSLQVLLQCLALDGDFAPAKKEVEKIVYDLVSPDCQKVKEGLQEMAQGSAPGLRTKTPVGDGQAKAPYHKEKCDAASSSESEEQPGLGRDSSLRPPGRLRGSGTEEGLKRVSSAPQLGRQDRGGALLKRKLSVSEAEPSAVRRGASKLKKQGDTGAAVDCSPAPCRVAPAGSVEASDFECPLCMRLFYEPVTTPCGHTFCRSCLERCLDHMTQCPLCKDSLKEYLATGHYSITEVLDGLIKTYLPELHLERHKMHTEETEEFSDPTKNVPMFVCTMAYPTVPCPLHVFEPRYRLMIRRCVETGTKHFGMCVSDPQKGFADYGCMLQIRSTHVFPDGRSVVDTVGWKRFQVLSRGVRDGYNVADIQFLEDAKVDSEQGLAKLAVLHDQVYKQACSWFQNLKSRFRGQILQHFGPMPEGEMDIQATPNGPAWCWWLLAVLPVDPRYQLSVLSMLSLKERLTKIQQILTYLQSTYNE
ncbi:LON peptidase N-terminal domain and RING finger protein 1-like [Anguilla anguilla]|uniref:LON peptidase N-terminal domain and RING finger protein 1-like n=1 Tax=Anguilla anguilla TaxID=7936 RepID=UPI0015AAF471|nr:LON peptidase N-terminal domain and RING finger protein 1-like [Anguilla anguilla]